MNWKYILFDLDGTLTEPKIGITKSFQYALSSFGIKEDNLDNLEKVIGPPLYDSFVHFYQFSEEDAKKGVAKYRERFEVEGWKENRLYDGIVTMLESLRDKKIAIASSKPAVFVERICKYFDIYKYFDVIVGSELDGTSATKIEIISKACSQLGVKNKEDVIMVGDRKFDIEGAHQFGIKAIGVNYGYAQGEELSLAGADYIAETVEELEKLLRKERG
ncbi:HAD-IA family hydrolase [[Clostridium] polysaccharolyticum]|uniref:Phosphoglycolate phosphatase n=1 Tax=[Clostridium] polysaccharolyticum TaxID=29364 RepID=A0A1I0D2J6_9FIRM|nr:HAD-IA family hydrolase [[Clostridium] polysaccharolyticum]SET25686.1 phosphoglycolate phosphatase [[Clostridium] polysaccharolyticum]